MPTDVVMPQMGESIFEGTITKWLKKAGDAVQKDEPLFEISTDKVDAEIPSPVAGVLTEIRVPEGTTVEINAVVAVVSENGAIAEAKSPVPKAASPAATPGTAAIPAAKAPAAPAPQKQDPEGPTAAGQTPVVMPQMGESIFEGTITKWLKKTGDVVQKDEALFEISTDKVDAEIPAPVGGILTEIKVPEGETVQINTVVAVIGGEGASSQGDGASAAPAASRDASATEARAAAPPSPAALEPPGPAAPLPAEASPSASGSTGMPDHATATPVQAKPTAASPAASASSATTGPIATAEPDGGRARIRSSPLVRRMARENHLDLKSVSGTGSAGRITKDDILRHLSQGPANGAAAASASAAPAVAQAPVPQAGSLVPMSRMRSIIAQRMLESAQTSPHAYSVYKVDMTRVVRIREREKAGFEQRNGVKLTYMPFIAAAAVQALGKYPIVNASLEKDAIRYHPNVHLGIAVALEWGLIVPVVKNAEGHNFAGMARAIADLAERARTKRLKLEEASGSTFTLTNSGIFGGEFGTPILNQPEAAILAIGGLGKEPVVLTDSEGNDTIAIRSMQHYCLGFDHRIIDGADAGKFMTEFKRTLETWDKAIG